MSTQNDHFIPGKDDKPEKNTSEGLYIPGKPEEEIVIPKKDPDSIQESPLDQSGPDLLPSHLHTEYDRVAYVTREKTFFKLTQVPDIYQQTDWVTIKRDHEDLFRVLYLDYNQYETITDDLVERHYKLLSTFWLKMEASVRQNFASPIALQYGITSSGIRTEALAKVYERLKTQSHRNLQAINYLEKRREEIKKNIIQLINNRKIVKKSEIDTFLTSQYFRFELVISKSGFTTEFNDQLKIVVDKNGLAVEDDDPTGKFNEQEKNLKNKLESFLSDGELSVSEEERFVEMAEVLGLTKAKTEDLIRKTIFAFRDKKYIDRFSVLEDEKRRLKTIVQDVLLKYFLDENNTITVEGRQEISSIIDSEDYFVALSEDNRNSVINQVKADFQAEIEKQRKLFKRKLDSELNYQRRESVFKQYLENKDYTHLSVSVRQAIIEQTVEENIQAQREQFLDLFLRYYREKYWEPTQNEIDQFIQTPDDVIKNSFKERVVFDWFDGEKRRAIKEFAVKEAKENFEHEKRQFIQKVKGTLSSFGLSVLDHNNLLDSKTYFLKRELRQAIIDREEAELRNRAVSAFTEEVKAKLVHGVLSAEDHKVLNRLNEERYYLSDSKNRLKKEGKTRTSEEIISANSIDLETYLNSEVGSIQKSKFIPKDIVTKYQLSYVSCFDRSIRDAFKTKLGVSGSKFTDFDNTYERILSKFKIIETRQSRASYQSALTDFYKERSLNHLLPTSLLFTSKNKELSGYLKYIHAASDDIVEEVYRSVENQYKQNIKFNFGSLKYLLISIPILFLISWVIQPNLDSIRFAGLIFGKFEFFALILYWILISLPVFILFGISPVRRKANILPTILCTIGGIFFSLSLMGNSFEIEDNIKSSLTSFADSNAFVPFTVNKRVGGLTVYFDKAGYKKTEEITLQYGDLIYLRDKVYLANENIVFYNLIAPRNIDKVVGPVTMEYKLDDHEYSPLESKLDPATQFTEGIQEIRLLRDEIFNTQEPIVNVASYRQKYAEKTILSHYNGIEYTFTKLSDNVIYFYSTGSRGKYLLAVEKENIYAYHTLFSRGSFLKKDYKILTAQQIRKDNYVVQVLEY